MHKALLCAFTSKNQTGTNGFLKKARDKCVLVSVSIVM